MWNRNKSTFLYELKAQAEYLCFFFMACLFFLKIMSVNFKAIKLSFLSLFFYLSFRSSVNYSIPKSSILPFGKINREIFEVFAKSNSDRSADVKYNITKYSNFEFVRLESFVIADCCWNSYLTIGFFMIGKSDRSDRNRMNFLRIITI